jgi:threonine dehydrogenase-like Zn-dependent dehydrogenase
MKAVAVFPKNRKVELLDIPEPSLSRPDEIKLRILEVGICGTDREIASFEYGTPPAGDDYLVIGHESLAEVIEKGVDVTRFSIGDLAMITVRRPCPHKNCVACRKDRPDFCYTGEFTERGIAGAHGFVCEHVVEQEKYVIPVPATMRSFAVLLEPLTVGEKALIEFWNVQDRLPSECRHNPNNRQSCHKVLVLGAGPVGLLGAMLFKSKGFDVGVYSRAPMKSQVAQLVESFGAKYLSTETTTIDQLRRQFGNIDVVYEATGAAALSFNVLKIIGTNSVFIFTGIPGRKHPIEIDADQIMRNLVLKNQIVYGTVNAGPQAHQQAVDDLGTFHKHWPDALGSVITGRYPIDDFEEVLTAEKRGIKNIITMV